MDGLEARVRKLERENRWMKLGGLLVLALAGGVALMGQTTGQEVSDEVRTRRLTVVDETEETRASLVVTEQGPVLALIEAGEIRAFLSVLDDVPKLTLFDEAGKPRASLIATKDGPLLALGDETGNPRASLDVMEGVPQLRLLSGKAQTQVALIAPKEGAALALYDESGKPRGSLSATKDGPGLELYDEAGQTRANLSVKKGGPFLALEDVQGYSATLGCTGLITPKTGTQTTRSAASLVMFDKDKNVIWKAPQ